MAREDGLKLRKREGVLDVNRKGLLTGKRKGVLDVVENQAQHYTTCEHTFENLCALKGQESYHSLHIKLCVIDSYSMTHN